MFTTWPTTLFPIPLLWKRWPWPPRTGSSFSLPPLLLLPSAPRCVRGCGHCREVESRPRERERGGRAREPRHGQGNADHVYTGWAFSNGCASSRSSFFRVTNGVSVFADFSARVYAGEHVRVECCLGLRKFLLLRFAVKFLGRYEMIFRFVWNVLWILGDFSFRVSWRVGRCKIIFGPVRALFWVF